MTQKLIGVPWQGDKTCTADREVPSQILQVPVQRWLQITREIQLPCRKLCQGCVQRPQSEMKVIQVHPCILYMAPLMPSIPPRLVSAVAFTELTYFYFGRCLKLLSGPAVYSAFKGQENCLIKMFLLHERLIWKTNPHISGYWEVLTLL